MPRRTRPPPRAATPRPDRPLINSSHFPALLEPRRPLRAILVGWAATSIPALLLSFIVASLLPKVAGPSFDNVGPAMAVMLVIVAPLLETLIMAAVLEILLLALAPKYAVVASSLGWGIAHSLMAPAWGLVIWWPFLIFSTLYVTWRGEGRAVAIGIVFAVHALNNLGPAVLLLFA